MDSDLLEEKEKFASDKEFFDEQRAALENERKQLTDAAITLGHEVGSIRNNISSFAYLFLLGQVPWSQTHQQIKTLYNRYSVSYYLGFPKGAQV